MTTAEMGLPLGALLVKQARDSFGSRSRTQSRVGDTGHDLRHMMIDRALLPPETSRDACLVDGERAMASSRTFSHDMQHRALPGKLRK